MGLHREIEKMLERPADAFLLREIIGFLAAHRKDTLSAAGVAEQLHRPPSHVDSLMSRLADLGVLSRLQDAPEPHYCYALAGAEAFQVEQFSRSKAFHERKLARSTDKFRAMYQRKTRR